VHFPIQIIFISFIVDFDQFA